MIIVYCSYNLTDFILFQGRKYLEVKCKTHRLKVIHKKISISNHDLFVVGVQKPTRLILSCNRKIYYENLYRKNILKHIMNIGIAHDNTRYLSALNLKFMQIKYDWKYLKIYCSTIRLIAIKTLFNEKYLFFVFLFCSPFIHVFEMEMSDIV